MAIYDLTPSDVKTIKKYRYSPSFSRIMTSGSGKPGNRGPIRRDPGGTPKPEGSPAENMPIPCPSRQDPEGPHPSPHAQISPHRAPFEIRPVWAAPVDSRLGPDLVPVENLPKYRPVCQNLPGNDLTEWPATVVQQG